MPNDSRIFLSPPQMDGREQELLAEVFASNYIAPVGPMLARFEQAFCEATGFAHCVALSSGTDAIRLGLRYVLEQEAAGWASEVKGLECGAGTALRSPPPVVLASTLTFIASVASAAEMGCELVFIDSDPATWNMDPNLLRQAITDYIAEGRKPAAIIPTDIYGLPCEEEIFELGREYCIPVLHDRAESLGATISARNPGRAATFSLNGNKIITCSGGGVLASDDNVLVEKVRFWGTQAKEDSPHYEHKELGTNARLSNVLAAIALAQLDSLKSRVAGRRAIFERYRNALDDIAGVSWMPEIGRLGSENGARTSPYPGAEPVADSAQDSTFRLGTRRSTAPNYWLSVLQLDPKQCAATPDELRLALEAENIESRPVWKPMHLQPVFSGTPCYGGNCAQEIFNQGLCLPSGNSLSTADQDRVIGCIRRVLGR